MPTIEMAKQYSVGSTLIVGEALTGRTTFALNLVKGKKTLWISFNNLGTVTTFEDFGIGSKLISITSWDDVPKEADGYEMVVLDGLNYAKDFWFKKFKPNGYTQQDWGKMSQELSDLVLTYRKNSVVVAVLDIETTAEGKKDYAINRAASQGLIGLFDRKVRTFMKPQVTTDAKAGTSKVTMLYSNVDGKEALTF